MNESTSLPTWKQLIEEEMALQQDAWENIEHATPSTTKRIVSAIYDKPDKYVDADFYMQEAQEKPFLIYTKGWIYFCVTYDGGFWVGSVPRHPLRRFQPEMFGC